MRFNVRKAVSGINMVRHGIIGLFRSRGSSSQPSKPAPTPKAPEASKVKVSKPPKPPTNVLKRATKNKQRSSFKSRMRTRAAQQTTTKREKQAAGAVALTRWRNRKRT
jgi:hypothetical protein